MEEKNIDPTTFTGSEEEQKKGIKGLLKKLIKKSIDWYMYPWGTRQNQYNIDIDGRLNSINEAVSELEKKMIFSYESIQDKFNTEVANINTEVANINTEVANINDEVDIVKDNISIIDSEIEKINIDFDRIFDSKERYYFTDNNPSNNVLKTEKSICQYAIDHKDNNTPNTLTDFRNMINETLLKSFDNELNKELIVFICENLSKQRNEEAIRKETFAIYKEIKEKSVYDSKIISLESNEENYCIIDEDIIYVSEDKMIECLNQLNIRLVVWNCSSIWNAHICGGIFKKYRSVFRLTCQNPFEKNEEDNNDYRNNVIFPLLHLNDLGFMNFAVLSKYTYEVLKKEGFRNIYMDIPHIDLQNINYNKHQYNKKNPIVLGMASSPMLEEQFEDRGLFLLAQVAKNNNYIIKLLWRNTELQLPKEVLDCKNIELIYGYQDMNEFYKNVDVVVIPYKTYDNNHACSLSAIEAMLNGIPVVSTSVSGVSDYVNKCGMGVVCEPDADSINDAIAEIAYNYEMYCDTTKRELLILLLKNDFVNYLESVAKNYAPNPIITLDDWKLMVESNGKKLVIGQEEIKRYYSQFEVAKHYTEDRFVDYPVVFIDEWERTTISLLIERKLNKKRGRILDIAPGDGRILQEDIKYGDCVAVDASEAMLNLVKERFTQNDNLKTYVGDYFVDDIDGKFDIITTFRYLRHFSYKDRVFLYDKIRNNLEQDGVLIFDVPNIRFECEQRNRDGWGFYNIYDVFWSEKSIISELIENGFRIDSMIPVGNGLISENDEPITWTIAAIKN